jgi:hypothetical protein
MPEISRFYGIVIRMYWRDHNPPHVHAEYSGHEALIDVRGRATVSGWLPARALNLVTEWAALHEEELLALWEKARSLEPLQRVDPLP